MSRNRVRHVGRARAASALTTLVALVGVIGLTAGPAAAAGTLDQQQPSADDILSFSDDGFDAHFAQTFQAGITGTLDQVDLLLARQGGTPPPEQPVTVQIRTVTGAGVPTSTILATAQIPSTDIPLVTPGDLSGFQWISVPLSPGAAVTAGTSYAVDLSSVGTLDPNHYLWAIQDSDLYAAGANFSSFDGGNAYQGPFAGDFAFKTYVTAAPPPASPAPACKLISVTLTLFGTPITLCL